MKSPEVRDGTVNPGTLANRIRRGLVEQDAEQVVIVLDPPPTNSAGVLACSPPSAVPWES